MAIEIEIKFHLKPEDLNRISELSVVKKFTKTPATREKLTSTYYDTPTHALRAEHIVLRTRKIGKEWIQTLKAPSTTPSMEAFQRAEYEWSIPSAQLNLTLIPEKDTLTLLTSHTVKSELLPIFSTEFWRTTWLLHIQDLCVEMALDIGEIKKDEQTVALCELELELKNGPVDKLYALAIELSKTLNLGLEHQSKSDRGYALSKKKVYAPVRAIPYAFNNRGSCDEAMVTMASNCINHIHANIIYIEKSEHSNCVDELHIGISRLQTCIFLLCSHFTTGYKTPFTEDLAHIMDLIQSIRLDNTLLNGPFFNQEDSECALYSILTTNQLKNVQRLRSYLQLPSSHRFLLSLGQWLHKKDWIQAFDQHQRNLFLGPLHEVHGTLLTSLDSPIRDSCRKATTFNVNELLTLHAKLVRQLHYMELTHALIPKNTDKAYQNNLECLEKTLTHYLRLVQVNHHLEDLKNDDFILPDKTSALFTWLSKTQQALLDQLHEARDLFITLDPFWSGV